MEPRLTKQQELAVLLARIRAEVPEVQGVILASHDGLPISTDFPEQQAARVGAMAATALGLARRVVQTLNLASFEEAVIRDKDGYLIVYAAGSKAVLTVASPAGASLGMIHLVSREVAQGIASKL